MAEAATSSTRRANVLELSVSELAQAIKRALEGGFGHVRLRGEISGFRGPHSSGHAYFSLKDEGAKIDAVIWRTTYQGLRFKPSEGLEVIATGRVTTYPGSSKYQIVIEALEPAGIGALMALLEERKKKLAAEGLFAEERKRKLPFLPRVVGIVTSPTGAVIRDMLHGFEERFPTHVIVWPVRVQGETSAAEVAAGIRGFNALLPGGSIPRPDVLIVARGGGSLEDLWSFNEEIVVRAAAESAIPLIAAVGHETDWTLIDLVADARAPTPTKAAEWAVPKRADLVQQVLERALRLATGVRRTLEAERVKLRAAARGLPRLEDLTALPRQRLDGVAGRLPRALRLNTHMHARRLLHQSGRLTPRLIEARLRRAQDRLTACCGFAERAMARRLEAQRARLERVSGRLRPEAIRAQGRRGQDRLGEVSEWLHEAFAGLIDKRRQRLEAHAQLLATLSHRSVLQRGFAIVRTSEGAMLRSASSAVERSQLELEMADGRLNVRPVAGSVHGEQAAGSEPQKPTTRPRSPQRATPAPGGRQGSLFE